MNKINIDSGGGGVSFGDNSPAYGANSSVMNAHNEMTAPLDSVTLNRALAELKGAILNAQLAQSEALTLRLIELEMGLHKGQGRTSRKGATEVLGMIRKAAGTVDAVVSAATHLGELLGL
jgi:hypothetical protein